MKKIIVIDDEDILRQCLHDSIMILGFDVVSFSNSREALNFILNNKNLDISIIFIDLNMPDIDGIKFVKKLRENNIKSKIAIMTGLKDEESEKQLKQIQYEFLLTKPFELMEINKILDQI